MAETRLRKFGFATGAESAMYDAVVGDINTVVDIDQAVFPSPDYEMQPNTHQLGPSIGPTKQRTLAKRHRVQLRQQWGTPHFLALAAAYTFGYPDGATAHPDLGTMPDISANAVGGRVHAFSIPKTQRSRPTFGMKEHIDPTAGNLVGRLYKGCGGESFSISANIGADRYVRIGWDVIMGDFVDSNPVIADSVTETDADDLLDGGGNKTKVFLGAGEKAFSAASRPWKSTAKTSALFAAAAPNISGLTDIKGDVHSFEFTYNNNPNLPLLYRMGSGKRFGIWERGEAPTASLRVNFKYNDEGEMDRYDENTELAFQANIGTGATTDAARTGASEKGATLIIPKMFYTGYSRENVSGEQVIAATFQPMWGGGASAGRTLDEAYLYIWNAFQTKYAA